MNSGTMKFIRTIDFGTYATFACVAYYFDGIGLP